MLYDVAYGDNSLGFHYLIILFQVSPITTKIFHVT